jgi:hypothetical protein
LTTLLRKKIIVAKSKEVKTGRSNSRQSWQNLLRKPMAKKGAVAPTMLMVMNYLWVSL